jgi:hypothetical protein
VVEVSDDRVDLTEPYAQRLFHTHRVRLRGSPRDVGTFGQGE